MQPRFNRGYPPKKEVGLLTDADYAKGRLSDRLYVTRSFTLNIHSSRDFGTPSRYIFRVFDDDKVFDKTNSGLEWSEGTVNESPGGRVQVKIQVAREAGNIRHLEIQRVTTKQGKAHLESLVNFNRQDAERLVELLTNLHTIPVEGGEKLRLPDDLLDEIFKSPKAISCAYKQAPDQVKKLVEQDVSAEDIAAIAHRKDIVGRFQRLLDNQEYFDESEAQLNAGPEKVWQQLFENDPWLLGVGLSEQLFTAWDPDKLEKFVSGHSVASKGKRVDALMKTNGFVRSLVFAEIKHHKTPLLEQVKHPFRAACWAPSKEVSGGVVQIQQTVYHATQEMGEHLKETNDIGDTVGDGAYLVRPRSYLIVGSLSQVGTDDGRLNEDKFRSFELYRRNLYEPIVVTFDELLARARYITELAEIEGITKA